MKLKILNRINFIQKFLSPISKINDLCTLTIEDNQIYSINRTVDNNFSLYSRTSDIELIDCEEKVNLSFSDIKKFIKILECINEDSVELILNPNNIEYKSSAVKFKFHLINDNIVKSPNFNLDKINGLEYNLGFKLSLVMFNTLMKSSVFITNSNKIYISTENGNIIGELNDKTKTNIDTYTSKLSDVYVGDSISTPLAFNFDLFRNISFLKTSELDVSLNTNKGIIAFDVCDDKYKLKYIAVAHVS